MTTLSKSRYLNGLQCKKLLWYQFNAKDKIPPPGESTMAIFEQGHQVGELAKKLFSKGIEVDHSGTFKRGLDSTKELIEELPGRSNWKALQGPVRLSNETIMLVISSRAKCPFALQ